MNNDSNGLRDVGIDYIVTLIERDLKELKQLQPESINPKQYIKNVILLYEEYKKDETETFTQLCSKYIDLSG